MLRARPGPHATTSRCPQRARTVYGQRDAWISLVASVSVMGAYDDYTMLYLFLSEGGIACGGGYTKRKSTTRHTPDAPSSSCPRPRSEQRPLWRVRPVCDVANAPSFRAKNCPFPGAKKGAGCEGHTAEQGPGNGRAKRRRMALKTVQGFLASSTLLAERPNHRRIAFQIWNPYRVVGIGAPRIALLLNQAWYAPGRAVRARGERCCAGARRATGCPART